MPPRIVAQFVALSATWGSSFLFIKIGVRGLSPAQVVWSRVVIGGLVLAVIVAVTRAKLPLQRRLWAHLAVVTVLLCLVPFALFAWAEQRIPSGLASVLNATTPLQTVVIGALALRTERLTRIQTAGLLLGFAGVLTVIGPWDGAGFTRDLPADAACLLATGCYGCAFVYLRRFVSPYKVPAVTAAFVQVGIGAVVMLAATPWIADRPVHLDGGIAAAMLALGGLGTGLAYVWNNNLISACGAATAATVTYLTPAVGVALGVAFLHEPFLWNQPAGTAVVVAGILVANGRLRLVRRGSRPQDAAVGHIPAARAPETDSSDSSDSSSRRRLRAR